ncbi:MAG: P27 family phage terminase small subunit [Planctomycetota bacterium]
MAKKRPEPPAHLRPDTRGWWQSVVAEYVLEAHHIRLLTLAAEAWDRGEQAREALAEHGTTYIDRFQQPHSRPEVAVERDSRVAFARILRELALDVSEPAEHRTPSIAGNAALRKGGIR